MEKGDPKKMKPWQRRARIAEINKIALNQLEAPAGKFDFTSYYAELRAMETRPKAFEDLETRIVLLLAARERPTRLRRLLGELRGRRIKANARHLFDQFEQSLKDRMGVSTLAGHNITPEAFADLDHDEVWEEIQTLVNAIGRLSPGGVFLDSGTLLGVVRDKRLIDHDDDVDLGFLLKAGSAEEAAREWRALKDLLRAHDLLDEKQFRDPAIYKIKSAGAYHVDLFAAWIEGGKVFVYPHTFGELDESDVFPLKTCEVSGLPIPAQPEKMLALNYGAGWKEPDPYFRFPWRHAKKKFKIFLDGVSEGDLLAKYKTVLTYGTFDLFHTGHVRLLRRLSAMAERLVVGCSTDEFNAIKGKTCVMSYEERAEILRSCSYVSEVFPENDWAQKRADIERYGADLFAMGDDWKGRFDDLGDLCKVIYLPRTEDVSTTELKSRVQEQSLGATGASVK